MVKPDSFRGHCTGTHLPVHWL